MNYRRNKPLCSTASTVDNAKQCRSSLRNNSTWLFALWDADILLTSTRSSCIWTIASYVVVCAWFLHLFWLHVSLFRTIYPLVHFHRFLLWNAKFVTFTLKFVGIVCILWIVSMVEPWMKESVLTMTWLLMIDE